ncbi:MAG: serine/threonine protein kinase [Mastigocoleus sp.]
MIVNRSESLSSASPRLLVNRYQVKQLIGKGGMGEVFLAEDVLLGRIPVAIKFLTQTFFEPQQQVIFAREARVSAALSQKSLHIVKVTDYGLDEKGKPFYVMEYLQGETLQDLMPIGLPQFLTLIRQICLGLQCAHQGIKIDGKAYPLIHRDIKPANILVLPDQILGKLAKILDFGVAKFLNTALTMATVNGFNVSLPYCSPEQLDDTELDSRSDIYSLGVVMFEMLTGKKPWKLETDYFGAWYKAHHFQQPLAIADVSPGLKLPQALTNLIASCLEKSPEHRPQSLTEIIQVLENIVFQEGKNHSKVDEEIEHLTNKSNPATVTPQSKEQDIQAVNTVSEALSSPKVPMEEHLSVKSPDNPSLGASNLSVEQVCKKLTWSPNKPIKEIVFPRLIKVNTDLVTTLSAMMSQQNINDYQNAKCYKQFVYITSPHPMLLWLTILYSGDYAPKWLPCYLDMQVEYNHKLINSLVKNHHYPLVLFTLEAPHSPKGLIKANIPVEQSQLLEKWVKKSQNLPPSNSINAAKKLLKNKYKKMQLRILEHLESNLAAKSRKK